MKIGVAGTFIRDRIYPWQREALESIGGIYFTVSFLANLMDDTVEILPVSVVGEDFYPILADQLASYPNVCLDGLKKVPHKHTQVKLVYTGPQERYEITTEPMPALRLADLAILNDADALLVNLITGSDLDLKSLRVFRKKSKALIYLDFHSHALGIDDKGKRFYRRPPDWQDWVQLVDILQLNEMEARTLAGLEKERPLQDLVDFGNRVLDMNPEVCHITLAEQGSLVFYSENGKKCFQKFNAKPVSKVVDIIGCGDAFAAGYLENYLATGNVLEATQMAIYVSAINCTFLGSSGVRNIRSLLKESETVAH
ncbi:MAG: carbohydrate kinase family protein [bacterium]